MLLTNSELTAITQHIMTIGKISASIKTSIYKSSISICGFIINQKHHKMMTQRRMFFFLFDEKLFYWPERRKKFEAWHRPKADVT